MAKVHVKPAVDRSKLSHLRPGPFDRFWFGAPYYPEHWDDKTREKDAERMAAAGFNVVRIGEFAWDRMEPAEGKHDFSFFDAVIERLGKKGVYTIMCTPTATPPRWLTFAHPEVLRVDDKGVAMQHGSRQHACTTGPLYREYSREITSAMAKHFAPNRNVVGWQTDNELHCHISECHCESCQRGFRAFLKRKYETIDELNRAWGNAFWALTYGSFEEIRTPVPNRPAAQNPTHQLDYYRFLSEAVTEFQHEQVEILRAANPKWFIFHNAVDAHIDYRGQFTKDLDIFGWDFYPMFAKAQERPSNQAFWLDRARAWSGNFIVPEQQSGPGGQAPIMTGTPEPGEMRSMAYRSIARGADSLMFFRWRTCRFGAEEYWCGILDHDNVPRRRYEETAQLGHELARVGPAILGTSVHVDAAVATSDRDNIGAHTTYALGLPGPEQAGQAVHKALLEKGCAVGCVHPSDDISRLKLYVIPHWVIINPAWVPNLKKFVEHGGTLVIGARTATRNLDNQVVGETLPGVLAELAGATVEEYGMQRDAAVRPLEIRMGKSSVLTSLWYETLKCAAAQPLFVWKGRHLEGQPAVTLNSIGKGRVVYVGTYFEDSVSAALAPALAEMSGLKPLWLLAPSGVEVVLRETAGVQVWFFINHSDSEVTIRRMPEGHDLISGRDTVGPMMLPRYGVAVVKGR